MENFKQGYQLTEEGQDIYAKKELDRAEIKARDRARTNKKFNKARSRHEHFSIERAADTDLDKTKTGAVPVTVPEQVDRFIDEGNPNTQAPAVAEEKPSTGTQPTEIPNIGKPDPQTPDPRAEESKIFGLYAIGEEESGETIEEELGEFPFGENFLETHKKV